MEGRLRRKRQLQSSKLTTSVSEKRAKQPNYEPPSIETMSKEEISNWRKNQRRLRNRQSAAASRQKQKDRIEELEAEVEVLKSRLAFYEKSATVNSTTVNATTINSTTFLYPSLAPPPKLSHQRSVPISPPNSPTLSFVSLQQHQLKPKRSEVP